MGREVRMVPKDWEHPENAQGDYRPLHEGFQAALADWEKHKAKWDEGLVESYTADDEWVKRDGKEKETSFNEYYGRRPNVYDYMPEWKPEERTHFMMYETTSEGTPISPAFATAEELARWLADNGASAFAVTCTYEQWLGTIRRGSSVSAVITAAGIQPGTVLNSPERVGR